MIIVAGRFEVDPARRQEFLASRRDVMEVTRAEEGCITYVYSADPIEDDVVHLFEQWENWETLDAHLAVRRAVPRRDDGSMVSSSEVLQYEIASYGPLPR